MGKGKPLTDQEKGMILAISEVGYCISKIAKRIARSRNVVRSFVTDPEIMEQRKREVVQPY